MNRRTFLAGMGALSGVGGSLSLNQQQPEEQVAGMTEAELTAFLEARYKRLVHEVIADMHRQWTQAFLRKMNCQISIITS